MKGESEASETTARKDGLEVKNCNCVLSRISKYVVLDVLEGGHTLIRADEQDINGDSAGAGVSGNAWSLCDRL